MATPAHTAPVWRFGLFEVDAHREELRRAGVPVKMRDQPFRLLVFFLEHAGEIVAREQLRAVLWPEGTFVDFDHSLNTAMMKLREALDDSAETPLYIETIPKKGYRFVAPVTESADGANTFSEISATINTAELPGAAAPAIVATTPRVRPLWRRPWVLATAVLAATVIAVGCWEWWSIRAVPYVTSFEAITHDGYLKDLRATDGNRVYFTEFPKEHGVLAQVSAGAGEVSAIPTPFRVPWLQDTAPDRSSLLVFDARFGQPMSLWIVPLPQGAPRRVGNVLADGATWTPDGKQIVFVRGTEIWICAGDGSQVRKLWTAPAAVQLLRISPDGQRMRFTVCEQSGCLLWEVHTDGSGAHRLLADWPEHPLQYGGSWSPDGRYYVFGAGSRKGQYPYEDLWLLPERRGWFSRRQPAPVQLTRVPLIFHLPTAFSPDGRTLFAEGGEQHGELMHFDPVTHQAAPYLSGISASEESFSPDGQWIAYISLPDLSLWRSRTDGSDRLQLTPPTGYASQPRWSPDGRRIAFGWTPNGTFLKLALISRDGGVPEQVIPDS